MITYYKSTDELKAHIQSYEARGLELTNELRTIRTELLRYHGKVLTLDWMHDDYGGALITVYCEIPFRIEFDQELDDAHHSPYIAYYAGLELDYYNTLLEAEKNLIKKAKREIYKKQRRNSGAKYAG